MKKYLPLLFIGFLFFAPQARAAISFVSATSTGELSGSTTNVTTTLGVTAGNLLAVQCRSGSFPGSSATDTVGNTWTLAATASDTVQGIFSSIFYTISSGSNASDTVNCNFPSSTVSRNIVLAQYSGVASTNELDTTSTNIDTQVANNATTVSAPFTTTNANDVALFWTTTAANPITCTAQNDLSSNTYTMRSQGSSDACMQDFTYSTIQTSQKASMFMSHVFHSNNIITTFKAASSAPTTTRRKIILIGD